MSTLQHPLQITVSHDEVLQAIKQFVHTKHKELEGDEFEIALVLSEYSGTVVANISLIDGVEIK